MDWTFDIPDALLVAILAGSVSIAVSLIGYLAALQRMKTEAQAFKAEMASKWTEKIYEERFRLYPEAFRITSLIRQVAAPHYLPPPEKIEILRRELNIWASEAGLFMSRDTAKAYMDLRRALAKQPGHGTSYSKEQGEKVWACRNKLRRALRKDVGNVYAEDDNTEAAEYWEFL